MVFVAGCVDRALPPGEEAELADPITAGAADGAAGYHVAFECPQQPSRAECWSNGCTVIEGEIYAFKDDVCSEARPAFFCVEVDEFPVGPQVFYRVVRDDVLEVITSDALPGDGTIHGYPEWVPCDFCPTEDSEPACQCPPWPECGE